jgi:hypothetical protein
MVARRLSSAPYNGTNMTQQVQQDTADVPHGVAAGRFLHVANGGCTTDIIEAAAIPGTRSIWADVLYEGPVPGGTSDDELAALRAEFLGGPAEGPVDPVNDLRRWRAVIADHQSYDELVLWFEHDLFDQLNLIQLLTWIRQRLPAAKPVSLVCIGSFPGHPCFKGLGELSPADFGSLFETRRPVSDAEYALAGRAWDAFRDSSPEAIDRLRRSDTAAMQFLGRALERFLQEYPSTIDGLSRTERRLLRLAERGPIGVLDAFPRMHDDEDAYYTTDGSLADLVTTLCGTSPPLLIFADDGTASDRLLRGTVTLTAAGREVLAGSRDRVACGLDRWLGGVHLQSGIAMWRWDDQRREIVPT